MDVELCEGEYFREFTTFQVSKLPELLFVNINYIALFINKVTFFVDFTAKIVNQPVLGSYSNNYSIPILFKSAHYILYVEALSIVVEQFWKISFLD